MPKALYRNREEFTDELNDQVALDTASKLSKAFQNKYHPLFREFHERLKELNEEINAAANKAAECKVMDLEIFMICLMKIREDAIQTANSIRDAIAAEELFNERARARELQAMAAAEEQFKEALLALQEIVQGYEDASAWIKSEKQNIKRVSADIAAIDDQIEEENKDWNELQQTEKVVAVDTLIAKHGSVMTIDLNESQSDGSTLRQSYTIDLQAKREQLEKASEIPAPSKILALNSMLNENMQTNPEKTLGYFDLLRDIRVVGALSANEDEVCDHRKMLALIKQKKISTKVSDEEKAKILIAVDLLKQRKAKEDVRDRLRKNLDTATRKFEHFEQLILANKEYDHPPKTLATDKLNLFGKGTTPSQPTDVSPKKPGFKA